MKNRSGLRVAALLALPLVVLFAVVAGDSLRLVGEGFPGFLVWDNGTLVSFHTESWTGARAGLPLNGGRVVAVDGRPFRDGRALLENAAAAAPGTPIAYRVAYQGGERDYSVPTMRLTWSQYLRTFGNYLLNAAFCFAIAVIALLLRFDHAPARALAVAMVNLGLLLVLAVDFLVTYRFVAVCQMVEATMPAAIATLAVVFPVERIPRTARFRFLPLLFLAAMSIGVFNAAWFYERPDDARQAWRLVNVLTAVAGFGLLASFSHALLRAGNVEERLRAAIVFAGALVAFLVPAIAILAFSMLGWVFSLTWATALLFFFPISIFYAVMRYDLLGAERFVRLTVGYAVATSSIVLVYATVLLGLDQFVSPEASKSPAAAFALLVAIAVSFDPLRRRVQNAVDRIFFRSVLDAGAVLEASGSQLATILDESEIQRSVGELLCAALRLEWAALTPTEAEAPDAMLREAVLFRGEPLGQLACGPKRSGAPFSSAERELVRGIASQAALAIRNARSIQALRETQDALLRSERLAEIGEFAGSVAHGIRNPLAGIRAAAQIALEQAEGTPVAETLTGVLGESDRLEQRVRTLLDFSRPFEVQPRPVDLEELMHAVNGTVAGQARRQGVEISVEVATESRMLETDPNYLEEALLEFASNSLRAMPEGGALRLCAAPENGHTAIRVSDTGSGIPPGVQGRVFELFFTTRAEGTGMGLATIKKIAERLGGRAELESSGPDGTTFLLVLG